MLGMEPYDATKCYININLSFVGPGPFEVVSVDSRDVRKVLATLLCDKWSGAPHPAWEDGQQDT